MTRILIADEHAVVREGLRQHLEANEDWKIVAEAADGREAILRTVETEPDVAILALALPRLNGIELTRQIRARVPKTEVVIFTLHNIENLAASLRDAGARGCVLKSEPMTHLIEAVQSAAQHRPYSRGAMSNQSNGSPLTDREREIVQLIAEGYSNKAIARLLGISFKTVDTHRLNIMRKLAFCKSTELVRYAVRNQLAAA